VITDWREPNVIRMAPVPLYNTFEDVFLTGKRCRVFECCETVQQKIILF
jgi:kynureninase